MELIQFLSKLEEAKIEYLIVGGIALNLHGVVRPTADLDLIVHLEHVNLNRFLELMDHLGFVPIAPVSPKEMLKAEKRKEWAEEKNMRVFGFRHSENMMMIVDVFLEEPMPFQEVYSKRVSIPIAGNLLSVMSIPDLILLKEQAGRLQDLSDIEALKEIQGMKK